MRHTGRWQLLFSKCLGPDKRAKAQFTNSFLCLNNISQIALTQTADVQSEWTFADETDPSCKIFILTDVL